MVETKDLILRNNSFADIRAALYSIVDCICNFYRFLSDYITSHLGNSLHSRDTISSSSSRMVIKLCTLSLKVGIYFKTNTFLPNINS